MTQAIHDCAVQVSWKMRTILRTRRFYNDSELVLCFKAHVLSYIEYRTPAFYHACATALQPLDRILPSFLSQIGLGELDAFIHFNMAPLRLRRDIAMLGMIHRSVLGKGPPQIRSYFVHDPCATSRLSRRHSKHLCKYRDGSELNVIRRSALGLIRTYNWLTQEIVDAPTVSKCQHRLTLAVKERAEKGRSDWIDTFSPRTGYMSQPLREI